MARTFDPHKLAKPHVYLWRMVIFLVIAGFVVLILYRPIINAFMANPGLNGLIVGVLLLGTILALLQVLRLFREVRWVNNFRRGDPGLAVDDPPRLLGPMASLLQNRGGRAAITPEVMRSILDTIASRLDETRDITRYLGGLLVFLGLLGTFWGLTETVSAVGTAINALDVGQGELGLMFEELKQGLAAPLGGMGVAFSSSLFGLSGSLVVGFLDLQASQAQNRFYNELEEWLTAITEPTTPQATLASAALAGGGTTPEAASDLRAAIDRLTKIVQETGASKSTAAMANLAEGIQGLVQHMRSEQQMIRSWVEQQSEQSRQMQRLIDRLSVEVEKKPGE
jgi:hypothetical protein